MDDYEFDRVCKYWSQEAKQLTDEELQGFIWGTNATIAGEPDGMFSEYSHHEVIAINLVCSDELSERRDRQKKHNKIIDFTN